METPTSSLIKDFEGSTAQNPVLFDAQLQRHEIEQKLAKHTHADATLALLSPEAAFVQVMKWYGIGKGDEVILSAYNPPWIGNAIFRFGAKPVLADVLQAKPFISPEAVRKAISERTKLIIGSNVKNRQCDFTALQAVVNNARVKGVFIPKTVAQQRLNRILLLSFFPAGLATSETYDATTNKSDITLTSFMWKGIFGNHDGAVLGFHLPLEFQIKEIYDQFALMASDGLDDSSSAYGNFNLSEPGYQALMSNSQVQYTKAKIEVFQALCHARIEIIEKFRFIFGKRQEILLDEEANTDFAGFSFSLHGITGVTLISLLKNLHQRGMPIRFLYKPLPMLTWYAENGYSIKDYPNSEKSFYQNLVLPVEEGITAAMIVEFADVLSEEMRS